jgi:hypothetical protein
MASEITLPPDWNGSHPKKPSATPSIDDLLPVLGFFLGLCVIALVLNLLLRIGVRSFETVTGIDCGLADYMSALKGWWASKGWTERHGAALTSSTTTKTAGAT